MSLEIDWQNKLFLREIHDSGLREGEQKGIQTGMRATLQHLLAQRFGPLPTWAVERLDSAQEGELHDALNRILTVATLQDVLPAAKTN